MGFEEGDKEGKVKPSTLGNLYVWLMSMTGKQLRRDLHNEERVPFAVTPRKGRGDETKVCPQVIKTLPRIPFDIFLLHLNFLGLKKKRPS